MSDTDQPTEAIIAGAGLDGARAVLENYRRASPPELLEQARLLRLLPFTDQVELVFLLTQHLTQHVVALSQMLESITVEDDGPLIAPPKPRIIL